jgi:hypothetical protein
MKGPQMPSGSTAAFTRTGARSFDTTQKEPDGTTALQATIEVSADGKTLTRLVRQAR